MKNNKQQTAVEYLVEQLFPKALSVEQYYHIEQAKEMEKERMIKFCRDWFISREMSIKEYYKQTYGGGEQ